MAGQTGVVQPTSILIRDKWVLDNLLKESQYSYTNGYAGGDSRSIIHQVNNENAKDGHNVIFQNTGRLTGNWKVGKETVRGTGEDKKLFSSSLEIQRIRTEVENADKFDAVNVGDLALSQHQESMSLLADMWVRSKDQAFFDVCQQSASHRILLENGFTFKDFGYIEQIVKTGLGYTDMATKTAIRGRRPVLESFRAKADRVFNQYILLIDPYMKAKLMGDSATQTLIATADVRGNENRLLNGVIGKIGSNITVVEVPVFDGITDSTVVGDFIDKNPVSKDAWTHQFNKHKVYNQGLRTYTGDDKAFVPKSWLGDKVANAGTKTFSRALLLGAGAVQLGYGMMPAYHYAESQDYGINSTSMLEVWCAMRARYMKAENDDYSSKIGGISYGIIAIDMQVD